MTPDSEQTGGRQRLWGGLFLLSASTLLFEVLLTKLFANKLEHHYTFAVISLALLGFGVAGVVVQLRKEPTASSEPAQPLLARYTWAFALLMPLLVALFLALPLDPGFPGKRGLLALPVYFALFAFLFLLAGLPITLLLVARGLHPARVYFWDLLGAAAGAALGPLALSSLGLYFALLLSSILAMAAGVLLRGAPPNRPRKGLRRAGLVLAFLFSSLVLLVTPVYLQLRYHMDLRSFKAHMLKLEFLRDFGGAARTWWNAIARIDVSWTGTSHEDSFRFGMPRATWSEPLRGRLILVDGGANSRQFLLDRHPSEVPLLRSSLWAFPYYLRPQAERTLLLGPGGGIDILIGKAFGVKEIHALELNPDVARLLQGRSDDPESEAYCRWLRSDERTQVRVVTAEARQYVREARGKEPYDIVLASGVDTLTAIQSSGNALTENFLYTKEAIRDYLALLKPGGLLALTHWRLMEPKHDIKILVTYLEVLEELGVQDPSKRIIVVSEHSWQNAILKKDEDFTPQELSGYLTLATQYSYERTQDPWLQTEAVEVRSFDRLTRSLVKADKQQRERILAGQPTDYTPATDERPYFYWLRPRKAGVLTPYDATWVYAGLLLPSQSLQATLLLALVFCALLLAAPVVALRRSGEQLKRAGLVLPFFALTGLAFALAENALFLRLALFVGGPLYSISLVLPAVLGGYGLGGLLSARIKPQRRSALVLAGVFGLTFTLFACLSGWGVPLLLGLPLAARVVLGLVLVVPFGIVLGLAVPWLLAALKQGHKEKASIAWCWATSSSGNVLGSLLFAPLCYLLGASGVLALTGALYLIALLWATLLWRRTIPDSPPPPLSSRKAAGDRLQATG